MQKHRKHKIIRCLHMMKYLQGCNEYSEMHNCTVTAAALVNPWEYIIL